MNAQEKLNDLYSLKVKIESKEFQDYVMKPLFAEIDKQKNAYDCESLRELAFVKGKKQGLKKIIEIFKQVDLDIKKLKLELEDSDE